MQLENFAFLSYLFYLDHITLVVRIDEIICLLFSLLQTSQGEIHHVLNPSPYRGVFGSDAKRYAEDVQDHIDHGTSGKVAGFIAETIQVCYIYFCLHVRLGWAYITAK